MPNDSKKNRDTISFEIPSDRPPLQQQIDDGRTYTDRLIREHLHDGGNAQRINLNTDILGLIEVVTSVPAGVPRDFYDQFKIYSSGTTYRFYWYDQVNHAWRYAQNITASSYGGQVAGDGSATILPTGWTSAKTGTGQYTVTHNLGTTSYGVAGLVIDANWRTMQCAAVASNSFSVVTWNATPTNTDLPFTFVLTLTS